MTPAQIAYVKKYQATYGRPPASLPNLQAAIGPRGITVTSPPIYKPPVDRRPMPPLRVPPLRQPPAVQPPLPPAMTPEDRWRRRPGIRHAHRGWRNRRRPVAMPPTHLPPQPYVAPTEKPAPVPMPVQTAPPTGPICPSWGWMVRTNPDGSETVVRCAIGQPAPAGLHGLDGLWDDISGKAQSLLGPNWMLYAGGTLAAYFLLFKRRR